MNSTIKEHIRMRVASLPLSPGVYQFIDSKGTIIYVGKAKSLKKRVSSYFVESRDHSAKLKVMVRQVVDIRHIVVDSEQDALLLENSLIKKLQPRYNILLKDDKTYPWIVIRNEEFPRVESTRQLIRDGSDYYGPYGSISVQRSILTFIRNVIPLRTCKYMLTEHNIAFEKYGTCLQYHLGNCNAPCIGNESREEYNKHVELARSILKGDLRPVKRWLIAAMFREAEALRFEQAEKHKQSLAMLKRYQAKSIIVSSKIENCDVFTLLIDDDIAYCNYLRLEHGSITAVQTVRLSVGINNEPKELLAKAIQHIVDNIIGTLSREIIVEHIPAAAPIFDGVTISCPKRGEKLKLIEFSRRNAQLYRAEIMKNLEIKNPNRHTERLMEDMRKELQLDRQPRHIECFDNSNLQGTNPVASCVVFRDGKPSRSEYRHFNIKTVEGPDDFASMREIVYRRYSRLLEEGSELPDLIIVDGGKGQLSSAYDILTRLGIEHRVPIIGLAKRIEEVFYPGDPVPYYLSRMGEPLRVICHIRDEAHRFGITFHRQKRSNTFLISELDGIQGIGPKSRDALMKSFKDMEKIRNATIEELTECIGKSKAQILYDHFNNNNNT